MQLVNPPPLVAELKARGLTLPDLYRDVAERKAAEDKTVEWSLAHLRNVIAQRATAMDALRTDLAEYFARPIEDLLDARTLLGRYRGPGRHARRSA